LPTLLDYSNDPLARFRDGARIRGSDRPMPMVDTAIDVRILGGLAIVRTARTFRNAESNSIEATITFPVPVHATIVALTASIDGRCLVGKARRKQAARETYESAIDSGRTAVLHEEAFRGIHILSIGHIPPGKDIVVTSIWAMPMLRHGGGAMLRIPVTIGDIFGRSPMSDNDDLAHAPAPQSAYLTIRCDTGVAAFRDSTLVNGGVRVTLDRPIDILLPAWTPRPLRGTAADGRRVTLEIAPAGADESPIRAALLLDQSSSMGEAVTGKPLAFGAWPGAPSKHQTMVDGVSRTLFELKPYDILGLWQFDVCCEPVYSLARLWGPRGGTKIGPALSEVVRHSDAVDVAIVTDGKSHDIDVHGLARSGRRFTAVLVGEDSLDAHVGHLVALTGGQLFVAPGNGAAQAISAAVNSMRSPPIAQPPIRYSEPTDVAARIGGMEIRACWDQEKGMDEAPAVDPDELRIVGAVAAAMAIPHMGEAFAAELAEAHGIVCHLTSLVMIDEAGEVQDGIPAQRKVPLMTPATQLADFLARPRAGISAGSLDDFVGRRAGRHIGSRLAGTPLFGSSQGLRSSRGFGGGPTPRQASADPRPRSGKSATSIASALIAQIDWSKAEALRQGDTSLLPPEVVAFIEWAAKLDRVKTLALVVQADRAAVVIALMARSAAGADRNAARLFRAILGKADPKLLAAAAEAAGL
jgi:hypothetical protein